tara:strand:- start:535 stop:726 length:192 start_codon:yes stop_codon:yes gene_type:complete
MSEVPGIQIVPVNGGGTDGGVTEIGVAVGTAVGVEVGSGVNVGNGRGVLVLVAVGFSVGVDIS